MVLALHGFLGDPRDYDFLNKAGIENRAPSFYRDNDWGPQHSLNKMYEKVIEFSYAQKQKGKSVSLLGYSMGGRIALGAFLQAPEAFKKVIFISTGLGLVDENQRRERIKADQVWASKFRTKDWGQVLQEWNQQLIFAHDFEPIRSELDYDRELIAQSLESWSLGHQPDFREPLLKSKTSSIWITGQRDTKYCEMTSPIARSNKNMSWIIAPSVGHRVIFSGFNAEIVKLLRQ